jgi:hypothetical protein
LLKIGQFSRYCPSYIRFSASSPLCLSVAFPERRSIVGATLTPTSAVLIDAVVV